MNEIYYTPEALTYYMNLVKKSGDLLKADSRYKLKRFEEYLSQFPKAYLAYLMETKKSGHVIETRAGKLWREHIVKKGIAKFKVYYNDKVIKRGVVK